MEIGRPTKSRKAESSEISMDNLHESLLTEILHRIPCIKSLVRCTSISHLWSNLISDPFFINRRLLYQQRPKPFTLMLNCHGPTSGDSVFQSAGFKLCFLPRRFVRISSSCNDLLLCYSMTSRYVYYICNPLTLKYLTLPPVPWKTFSFDKGGKVGLISNYQVGGIENQWKHRVVRIHGEMNNLVAEIFSFEMGNWTEKVVLGPYYKLCGNSVAYNGVLHWLAEPSSIIAFDFDAEEQYRMISCPITMTMIENRFRSQCLGVSCGVLRILELAAFQDPNHVSLRVWELEDYPNGNWNVVHMISFKEFVPAKCPRVQIKGKDAATKYQVLLKALGIHPTDRDVVFLQIHRFVVSIHLEAKKLKIEAKPKTDQVLPFCAFPVELQGWPTPIPSLPQGV